ncbi:MAG: TonB-dependent receptor [Gammaproteobacteria bacterium]
MALVPTSIPALVLAVVLGLASALAPGVAQAKEPPGRPFQIETQPVSSALRAFAEQAQVQLIFSEADVGSLNSSPVIGYLSPRAALESLLHGTALEFEFTESNVAVVRKPRNIAAAGNAGPARSGGTPGPSRQSPSPYPYPGASSADANALQEVTVTGSRILRRDLDAKSPIFTVDQQAFDESSTLGVETVLNQLPQFVPAGTQFVTNDVFPTSINTPGVAALNLRGLATNRTLVLIDGRRAQPANSTLIIDMNTIPSSAISKVEVITGGASATYGADAMGGVTNFKLRENFQGATFEMRSGITEAGDGAESRVSTLLGANLEEGRGNVMLGIEWTKRSAANIFGRPFFEDALTDPGAPATSVRLDHSSFEPNASTGGLPSQAAVNALFPERAAGTNVSRTSSFYVNRGDDTLFKDTGALGYTGEYNQQFKLQPNGSLGENTLTALVSSPLERYSFLGRGHYALTDRVEAFAQATFANIDVRSSAQPSAATGSFGASIPRDADHPVPQELAALLDSRGPNVLSTTEFDPNTGLPLVVTGADASWRLGRPLDFLPSRQLRNATSVYQLLAGFRGPLPFKDWTWEAYATHGESKTDNEYIGFASLQRYRAVVQAPNYGRGFSQTGLGQTQITCTTGLPIFEQFQVSQDCIDAITINSVDRTRLSQDIVEVDLQGAVTALPAGEARAAVGATYRKNDLEFRPDALREPTSVIDIPVGTFSNARVHGDTEVDEAYAELLLPLVRGVRFVDSLELELGARYSRYDTAGSVPTYKALFSWSPIESVRFRGGYQLANRAPNINELFLTSSSVPINLRGPDPCRSDTLDANGNRADNPNRAKVQALCSAIIGTGTSTFDENPNSFLGDGRTDGGEVEIRSGNPDVKSEQGRTWTLGVVLKSPFEHALSRSLTFTVDWYRAAISEAIAQVGAQTTYDLCFNRDGLSNPTYSIDDPNGMCRRISRNEVTGDRQSVTSTYANLGRLETSGIDVQASWAVAPAELGFTSIPGTVALDVSYNKLLEFLSQTFPTAEVRENKGTLGTSAARGALFSYRALTTLRYTAADMNVGVTWRRLPSVRNAAYVTDPLTPFSGAESYNLFDIAGGWSFNRMVRLTLGIDNLLDRDPNRTGVGPGNNGAGTTTPGNYDVLGRRYYAAIRLMF